MKYTYGVQSSFLFVLSDYLYCYGKTLAQNSKS